MKIYRNVIKDSAGTLHLANSFATTGIVFTVFLKSLLTKGGQIKKIKANLPFSISLCLLEVMLILQGGQPVSPQKPSASTIALADPEQAL